MPTKNLNRLLRALARQGLKVSYQDNLYSVRFKDSPNAPTAEVLLPEQFPIEAKALIQLAHLANVHHPEGGCVHQCCATPDFHPGDGGVAIGSVIETEQMVIPAAVGSDINCGMRLHLADLSVERFLALCKRKRMGDTERCLSSIFGTTSDYSRFNGHLFLFIDG